MIHIHHLRNIRRPLLVLALAAVALVSAPGCEEFILTPDVWPDVSATVTASRSLPAMFGMRISGVHSREPHVLWYEVDGAVGGGEGVTVWMNGRVSAPGDTLTLTEGALDCAVEGLAPGEHIMRIELKEVLTWARARNVVRIVVKEGRW